MLGKEPDVKFGDTARAVSVLEGKVVLTGAGVRIDTSIVERERPDPTGVTTTVHEVGGHVVDMMDGATDAELEANHDEVEQLGQRAAAEEPDITEEQAEELLEKFLVEPERE
jgi:hypothetical protein